MLLNTPCTTFSQQTLTKLLFNVTLQHYKVSRIISLAQGSLPKEEICSFACFCGITFISIVNYVYVLENM